MEIDVTRLVTENDMFEFSASAAERGANAGKETWANAEEQATANPILTEDQLPEFRDYAKDFGTWEREEIDAWTHAECDALFIQMVAGDIREAQSLVPGYGAGDIDWEAYEKLSEAGTTSGRIFEANGGVYYYVGS